MTHLKSRSPLMFLFLFVFLSFLLFLPLPIAKLFTVYLYGDVSECSNEYIHPSTWLILSGIPSIFDTFFDILLEIHNIYWGEEMKDSSFLWIGIYHALYRIIHYIWFIMGGIIPLYMSSECASSNLGRYMILSFFLDVCLCIIRRKF